MRECVSEREGIEEERERKMCKRVKKRKRKK
jgi:hypothetical protein